MYKKIILSLLLVSSLSAVTVFSQSREGDSLALVDLYNSTDGDNWDDNTNWKSGTIDTWYGVTVSGGRVTKLDLPFNELTGTLPSSIGNLTGLLFLVLSDNELTGLIPSSIGNLTGLQYLLLDGNQLTGSIPSSIGNLTDLLFLFLSDNELTGSIPSSIGNPTGLQYLLLDGNQFTGSIPAEIWNLTSLQYLSLNDNQLTGSIPAEIQKLTNLNSLYLNDNDLIGLSSLSDLPSLVNLRVQNNKFTFEDIEPNIGVASNEFNYSPQDSVGESIDTTINEGSTLSLAVSVGGTSNEYQWKKDGSDISGANSDSYTITSAEMSDAGSYTCEITNTVATDLTLYSKPVNVTVNSASPKITVTSPNGGEDWKIDSTYNITWISNGTSGDVEIEYSTDNGSDWIELIASMPDIGVFSWIIPDDASDSCMVRISDTDGSPADVSDSVFSIFLSSAVPLEEIPQFYSMSVKTLVSSNKFTVRYSIPENTSIKLGVYSINGTKIKEISEVKSPGVYTKEIDMKNSPLGIYFVKMETNGKKVVETEKVVFVK